MKHTKKSRILVTAAIAMAAFLMAGNMLPGALVSAKATQEAGRDSPAYQLIAQLSQVDTDQPVSQYTQEIQALCDAAGTSLFQAMADAEIIEPGDPLYAFATGSLACTASEMFAESGANPEEKPYMDASIFWERYPTEEEIETYRGDLNDEEWAAYLEAAEEEEPIPIAMQYVYYVVEYQIHDRDTLTIARRDEILASVESGMQAWMDGQEEAFIFGEDFEAGAAAEMDRLVDAYSTEEMTMTGEIMNIDGFEPGASL